MPRINQYTRQVAPQGLNVQASADDFGAAQGRVMEQAGNVAIEINQRQIEAARRLQAREETIARIRTLDIFKNEALEKFNTAMTEEDLINPEVAKKYNMDIRARANEILGEYKGSPEGRLQIEAELTSMASQYSQQMNANALSAQRKFITDKAGEKINELSAMVASDPSKIGDAFSKINDYLTEISPTLYAEDELNLSSAAQQQIIMSALQTYTDSGHYEEAKNIIDDNPHFLSTLNPATQREVMKTISSGIAARDKEIRETRNKINAVRSAASELNVNISDSAIFQAATGISNQTTPQGKVEEFAQLAGKKMEELTPSVIAKIAYGVDLPSATETDFNKDYTPDGKLTPKGIGAKIAAPFQAAAAAKTYNNKVQGAIKLFRESGNKQALLSAMISFQKALDEGAVVREGDIALQREAQSLSDKLSLFVKPGQVIGDELVSEMEVTMTDFTNKALESAKVIIDPYIEDASARGFRALDYGLPQDAYNDVFRGIKAKSKDTESGMKQKATLTLDEFLQQ